MSDRALIVLDELDQFIKANKLHTYALSSEWAIDVDELQEKMKEIRTRMAASHNNILQINISEYNSFLADKKHVLSNPLLSGKGYVLISDLNDFLTNCGTIIEEKKEGN
jgi:hypothetical protein